VSSSCHFEVAEYTVLFNTNILIKTKHKNSFAYQNVYNYVLLEQLTIDCQSNSKNFFFVFKVILLTIYDTNMYSYLLYQVMMIIPSQNGTWKKVIQIKEIRYIYLQAYLQANMGYSLHRENSSLDLLKLFMSGTECCHITYEIGHE